MTSAERRANLPNGVHQQHQPTKKLKASPIDEIARLKQQIVELQDVAVAELRQKRKEHEAAIQSIDAQIAELTGRPSSSEHGRRTNGVPPTPKGKNPSLQELKLILEGLTEKTL